MKLLLSLVVLVSTGLYAQTGSEIFLLDLQSKKAKLSLSNAKNITNHTGYDNQPSFHSDKPLIYYSSFNDDGRSDIKIFNYKTGETTNLTKTSEREYSPTLTPDQKFISCIIQRDNNAQDLGKYPVEGGQPTVIIDNLIVGYHAWIDDTRLLLFVLGEPQTLRLYDTKTKSDKILAEKIGRSLHAIPGQNAMSFVHKISDSEWIIKRFDKTTGAITDIATTLPGREDLCWTPDGKIIMSDGSKIYWLDPAKEKKWIEIPMQANDKIKGITRLAINKKGTQLAVVVAE
jgi:WD40-like Beta Propeller Repeat